jgi:hypothetical protein
MSGGSEADDFNMTSAPHVAQEVILKAPGKYSKSSEKFLKKC